MIQDCHFMKLAAAYYYLAVSAGAASAGAASAAGVTTSGAGAAASSLEQAPKARTNNAASKIERVMFNSFYMG